MLALDYIMTLLLYDRLCDHYMLLPWRALLCCVVMLLHELKTGCGTPCVVAMESDADAWACCERGGLGALPAGEGALVCGAVPGQAVAAAQRHNNRTRGPLWREPAGRACQGRQLRVGCYGHARPSTARPPKCHAAAIWRCAVQPGHGRVQVPSPDTLRAVPMCLFRWSLFWWSVFWVPARFSGCDRVGAGYASLERAAGAPAASSRAPTPRSRWLLSSSPRARMVGVSMWGQVPQGREV